MKARCRGSVDQPVKHTMLTYVFVYLVESIILYYVLFHMDLFLSHLYADRSWVSTYSKRACTYAYVFKHVAEYIVLVTS